jgi:hypothetical protein
MPKISDLLAPQAGMPLDPSLGGAMNRVQGNITDLLNRSTQPSVGDVGRSLLLSAAYRGAKPHTEFLQQDQAKQYELVGAQANMVSQLVQMRMQQAKQKAGSNPLADFLSKDLAQLAQENPIHANAFVEALEADPEPYSIEQHMRVKAATAPEGKPDVVDIPYTDEGGVERVQHEIYNPYGYQTNTSRTLKQSPKTEVNIVNNMSPNDAARTANIAQSKEMVGRVRSLLVNPDGSVNRTALTTSVDLPGLSPGLPMTSGRTLQRQMRIAIAAKLRADTGAEAPEHEVEEYLNLWMPGATDTDEAVKAKLNDFEAWATTALGLAKGGAEADQMMQDKSTEQLTEDDIKNMSTEEIKRRLNGR